MLNPENLTAYHPRCHPTSLSNTTGKKGYLSSDQEFNSM